MGHLGFKVRDIEAIREDWRSTSYEVESEFTGAEGFPNGCPVAPDRIPVELQEDATQGEDAMEYHTQSRTPDDEELLAWYVEVFGAVPFQRGMIATTADASRMNLGFGDLDTPRGTDAGKRDRSHRG